VKANMRYLALAVVVGCLPAISARGAETVPESKALMQALTDEMNRSMSLQMEDLEKPYFIQYLVNDSLMCHVTARYGDLTGSDRDRSRRFYSQVRVGSYELDNTNFSGDSGGFFRIFGGPSGGGQASLPIEENYDAIRQAIWWATDQDYKDAVETLTKKRAYMRDKKLEDRPNDFSKASIVQHTDPALGIEFDRAAWEQRVKDISAHFNKYPAIQDSQVQLYVGLANRYVVNTEGTRLCTPDQGALLIITAELQADDGTRISDGLNYYGYVPKDLPAAEHVLADIDELVGRLTQVAQAPVLERYTGPVLFDNLAAAQMFRTMLAEAAAGRVEPVGTQRRGLTGAGSLEKKLGQRILPRSFRIYDDPLAKEAAGTDLMGHYVYDDEGVHAERVDLVQDGVLKNLVMSRVPTKKLSSTNGHGRCPPGDGTAQSAIANLFVEDTEGVSDDELKDKLVEMAQDEGLEYGLRIGAVRTTGIGSSQSDMFAMFMRMQQRGGQENVGDPIYIYKVYVDDGREELVRGCEFGQVKLRDLKHIEAGGKTPAVYNYVGFGMGGATPATSIIAPGVLFEELELSKIEQEHDTKPILKSPLDRS
jgi:TldD protein